MLWSTEYAATATLKWLWLVWKINTKKSPPNNNSKKNPTPQKTQNTKPHKNGSEQADYFKLGIFCFSSRSYSFEEVQKAYLFLSSK